MATSYTAASTFAATCLLIVSFIVVSSLYITKDLSSSHFDCTRCFYLHTDAAAAAAAHHHVTYPAAIPSSRKILMGVMGVAKARGREQDSSERRPDTNININVNNNNNNEGVELRNVPSGPDPLHHNGAPQRRPRISP